MALKHWIIGGTIALTTAATAFFGVPRVVGGTGKLLWYGAAGKPDEPQKYVTLRYNVSKDRKIQLTMPEESQGTVANYLAMHEDCPEQTALELLATDADDGTIDGIAKAQGIHKLVHGYFKERAKDYNGRVPLQEIFKDSPLYSDSGKPGSHAFELK